MEKGCEKRDVYVKRFMMILSLIFFINFLISFTSATCPEGSLACDQSLFTMPICINSTTIGSCAGYSVDNGPIDYCWHIQYCGNNQICANHIIYPPNRYGSKCVQCVQSDGIFNANSVYGSCCPGLKNLNGICVNSSTIPVCCRTYQSTVSLYKGTYSVIPEYQCYSTPNSPPGSIIKTIVDNSYCLCTPSCVGKSCGDDGCGGSCGSCTGSTQCNNANGQCQCNLFNGFFAAITFNSILCCPSCNGKQCGSDGCGGSCGTCSGNTVCNSSGTCVNNCIPLLQNVACTGKSCGDVSDGCGNILNCGSCSGNTPICSNGQCVNSCTPDCTGKSCGNDGCGGSCGTCSGNTVCDSSGQCVPRINYSIQSSSCPSDYCLGSVDSNGFATNVSSSGTLVKVICGDNLPHEVSIEAISCNCNNGVCESINICGNGVCDNGETSTSCPADCTSNIIYYGVERKRESLDLFPPNNVYPNGKDQIIIRFDINADNKFTIPLTINCSPTKDNPFGYSAGGVLYGNELSGGAYYTPSGESLNVNCTFNLWNYSISNYSASKTVNVNSIENGICGDSVCDIAAGENNTLDLGYKKEKICEKDCGVLASCIPNCSIDNCDNIYTVPNNVESGFLDSSLNKLNQYSINNKDPNGKYIWYLVRAILTDGQGNIYVNGLKYRGPFNFNDGRNGYLTYSVTAKFDSNKNLVWIEKYEGESSWVDNYEGFQPFNMTIDSSRNIYVLGARNGANGYLETLKYDTNGNLIGWKDGGEEGSSFAINISGPYLQSNPGIFGNPSCTKTTKQCGDDGCGGVCFSSSVPSGHCAYPQTCNSQGQCVAPICGNGICETGENYSLDNILVYKTFCQKDCPVCGDGVCESSETTTNCAKDCSTVDVCASNIFKPLSNATNFICVPNPMTCSQYCGGSSLESQEFPVSPSLIPPPQGMPGYQPLSCGRIGITDTCCSCKSSVSTCTSNCTGKSCGSDGCSGSCGTCSTGKTCDNGNCVSTINPFCGDGVCNNGETIESCAADCSPSCTSNDDCALLTGCYGYSCISGKCKENLGKPAKPCGDAIWKYYPTCSWDSSACKGLEVSCPPGTNLDDYGKCVLLGAACGIFDNKGILEGCPSGFRCFYEKNNGECIADLDKCPDGTKQYKDGMCVVTGSESCGGIDPNAVSNCLDGSLCLLSYRRGDAPGRCIAVENSSCSSGDIFAKGACKNFLRGDCPTGMIIIGITDSVPAHYLCGPEVIFGNQCSNGQIKLPDGTCAPKLQCGIVQQALGINCAISSQSYCGSYINPNDYVIRTECDLNGDCKDIATACNGGTSCSNGECVAINSCTSNCTGKSCGSDGCGGQCGTCSGNTVCDSSGQCVNSNDNLQVIKINATKIDQSSTSCYGIQESDMGEVDPNNNPIYQGCYYSKCANPANKIPCDGCYKCTSSCPFSSEGGFTVKSGNTLSASFGGGGNNFYFLDLPNYGYGNIVLNSNTAYDNINELSALDTGEVSFDLSSIDPYQIKDIQVCFSAYSALHGTTNNNPPTNLFIKNDYTSCPTTTPLFTRTYNSPIGKLISKSSISDGDYLCYNITDKTAFFASLAGVQSKTLTFALGYNGVNLTGNRSSFSFYGISQEFDGISYVPARHEPYIAINLKSNNICTPDCSGKSCGSDGCEGQCGTCSGNAVCDSSGKCVNSNDNLQVIKINALSSPTTFSSCLENTAKDSSHSWDYSCTSQCFSSDQSGFNVGGLSLPIYPYDYSKYYSLHFDSDTWLDSSNLASAKESGIVSFNLSGIDPYSIKNIQTCFAVLGSNSKVYPTKLFIGSGKCPKSPIGSEGGYTEIGSLIGNFPTSKGDYACYNVTEMTTFFRVLSGTSKMFYFSLGYTPGVLQGNVGFSGVGNEFDGVTYVPSKHKPYILINLKSNSTVNNIATNCIGLNGELANHNLNVLKCCSGLVWFPTRIVSNDFIGVCQNPIVGQNCIDDGTLDGLIPGSPYECCPGSTMVYDNANNNYLGICVPNGDGNKKYESIFYSLSQSLPCNVNDLQNCQGQSSLYYSGQACLSELDLRKYFINTTWTNFYSDYDPNHISYYLFPGKCASV